MTQVLNIVTHDYIMFASDRRLTYASGKMAGQVFDDNECKLVCLRNASGIGYTGLAEIDGVRTHEWIACMLADEDCRSNASAIRALVREATRAFAKIDPKKVSQELRRHEFLITGWEMFGKHACDPFMSALPDHRPRGAARLLHAMVHAQVRRAGRARLKCFKP